MEPEGLSPNSQELSTYPYPEPDQLSSIELVSLINQFQGARGSAVAKALCYIPEGRGFDTRWGDFFNFT
jgi:hypothetical protein